MFTVKSVVVASLALALPTGAWAWDSPFAATVVSFDAGVGGSAGYDDPATALGPPEQFTGEEVWPGVVSPFNPPWLPTELCSIGAGGHLTVAFETWVENDADNPHGIDLIIFGNTGFVDESWPDAIVSGLFGDGGGEVLLSEDGTNWHAVPGCLADGVWPTLGWLDAGPYDAVPGVLAADPRMPMSPAADWGDLVGHPFENLQAVYGTSAGGVGIDLDWVGLDRIRFVRIQLEADALLAAEIDALADVLAHPAADINGDGVVDVGDLLLMLEAWGPVEPGHPADLDGDGFVAIGDVLELIAAWTT